MANIQCIRRWLYPAPDALAGPLIGALVALGAGCSSSPADTTEAGSAGGVVPEGGAATVPEAGAAAPDAGTPSINTDGSVAPASPFRSLEAAANAPTAFTQPRGGVPLKDGRIAFLATLEGVNPDETTASGERIALLLQPASGGVPSVLYAGDKLVNPFDLDVSLDETTLYVADVAAGAENQGAILTIPVSGGEPTEALSGYAPRGVTVAPDGQVYFSGIDPASGEPGVFLLAGAAASKVFAGAPLVDPSGIAVMKDGGILVSDTRLFDRVTEGNSTVNSEAGVVLLKGGAASIFATGFVTGYPAGIALTSDDKTLIVSGEGPDRSDTVYIIDVAHPSAPALAVTDKFSAFQDSSAGLKRAHDSNTFIWASLAAGGGTIYRIRGN